MWQNERHNGSFDSLLLFLPSFLLSLHASNVIAINVIWLEVNFFPFRFGAFWFNALSKSKMHTPIKQYCICIAYCASKWQHLTRKPYIYYLLTHARTQALIQTHVWSHLSFQVLIELHIRTSLTTICNCWLLLLSLLEWISKKRGVKIRKNAISSGWKIRYSKSTFAMYIQCGIIICFACGVEKAKRSFIRFTVVHTLESQLNSTQPTGTSFRHR